MRHQQKTLTPSIKRAAVALGFGVFLVVSTTAATPRGVGTQQSSSSTLHVSMNVVPNCTVSATPLDFGSYNPVGTNATAPLDAEALVTTVCTPNTRLSLEMNRGLSASGNTRRMNSGTDFLPYEIFRDVGRAQIWGTGAQALRFLTPANSTAPVRTTVYGRIEPGQDIAAGDYADTIEIILHF